MDKLEDNYRPVYDLWKKDPTPRNNTLMLQAAAPLLSTAVRTYGGANASPALRSRAKQIFLKALPRYDASQAKLKTFVMQQMQSLQRYRFAEQEAITLPEQIRLDQSYLTEQENELSDRHGRAPSLLELADATGLSPQRISHIQGAQSGFSEGTMTPTEQSGAVGGPAAQLPGADDGRAWTEFVYYGLDPTDQVILEHSTGLFGRPTLSNQDIAAKLRISPPAVSQRRSRIQEKLDQRSDFEVL